MPGAQENSLSVRGLYDGWDEQLDLLTAALALEGELGTGPIGSLAADMVPQMARQIAERWRNLSGDIGLVLTADAGDSRAAQVLGSEVASMLDRTVVLRVPDGTPIPLSPDLS